MKKQPTLNSYLRLLLYTLAAALIFSALAGCLTAGEGAVRRFFAAALSWVREQTGAALWVLAVFQLILALAGYWQVERLMKLEARNLELDAEDDCLDYRIEAWTTYINVASHAIFILSFLLFAASLPGQEMEPGSATFDLVPFLITSVTIAVYGIAYVKQAQRRDPSKKGDPAKLMFNREWLSSCDEAEKEMTYQAAYRSMQISSAAIPLFLLGSLIGHMMFGTGILAVLISGGIWGISSLSYMLCKLKLLKTKLNQ